MSAACPTGTSADAPACRISHGDQPCLGRWQRAERYDQAMGAWRACGGMATAGSPISMAAGHQRRNRRGNAASRRRSRQGRQQAPYSGFLRMGSGRTVVIMDAGDMARGDDIIAGSGTLGFEMSVGPTQLVVNSGQMMKDPTLRGSCARRRAFDTWPRQPEFIQSARRPLCQHIEVEVGEAPGGLLAVRMTGSSGPRHHPPSQTVLKTGGANPRRGPSGIYRRAGRDSQPCGDPLPPPEGDSRDAGQRVGSDEDRGSRVGWNFKADGAIAEIDNSVYFEDGVRQSSQQIILKAIINDIRTTGSHEIRWAFSRGAQ